jgi:tetratricopeptide (TPR) repeat protein
MQIQQLLFLAVALGVAGSCSSTAAGEALVAEGIVIKGATEETQVWFEFDRTDMHFVMDRTATPDVDAVFAALKDSNSSGRSLQVTFDPAIATFDRSAGLPSYIAQEIVYNGKHIAGQAGGVMRAADETPLQKSETQLALGIAYYNGGDQRRAVGFLDTALKNDLLLPEEKTLALKTRGAAKESQGYDLRPARARDALYASALSDHLAWESIRPDDVHAAMAVAESYANLGGYDEALADYQAIIGKWPNEKFWAYMRVSGIHRSMGHPDKALAALDELVAKDGKQDGMAYHYHRGWTLADLGRWDEAIAEFTAGLASQPDYAWAFSYRACAYATAGKLGEAIADQKQFIARLESEPPLAAPSPSVAFNLQHAKERLAELQTAVANGTPSLGGLCDGYWTPIDEKRNRSDLLPKLTQASQ